jgi:hypothetical protein
MSFSPTFKLSKNHSYVKGSEPPLAKAVNVVIDPSLRIANSGLTDTVGGGLTQTDAACDETVLELLAPSVAFNTNPHLPTSVWLDVINV